PKMLIPDQKFQIILIQLRKHTVEEFSSFLTSSFDKLCVIRPYQYNGQQTNMLTHFVIGFAIVYYLFFFTCLHNALHFNGFVFLLEFTFDGKKCQVVQYILQVYGIESTFGKAEVMDCIQ